MLQAVTSLGVLAVCLAPATAFIVVTVGYCPHVTTKPDFELQKYLGLWFSYENFDIPFQIGLSCVTALYSPSSKPGAVQVVNTGKQRIKLGNEYRVTGNDRAVGEAVVVNPDVPGGLRVSFGGSMPDFLGDAPNYQIIDTDYSNFSIVYSCYDFKPVPFKVEAAWILTRTPGPPPNRDAIHAQLTKFGINVNYFRRIDQNKCWT